MDTCKRRYRYSQLKKQNYEAKDFKSFILVAGGAFLFSSCNSDDDIGGDASPLAVQFGTANIAVRTTSGGNNWTQNDPVGIYMVKNGQTLSSGNIAEGADNRQYQAQTGNSNQSGFTPVGTSAIYYPQDGSQVDFIAYYPYKATGAGGVDNYTYPVDVSYQFTPGNTPTNIDVLYANTANTASGGYNKNSSTVNLKFNHVLSKLSFTLISGTGSPNLTGTRVEITNLATTADMSLADGTVTATNSGQSLTAHTATDGLSSSAIVIPQALSGTKLIVILADNVSKFEWDFPANTELQTGKDHQYTITVSKTGITVSSSGITTWAGTGDPATPGTAAILTQYKVGDYYPDPANSGTAIGVVFWVDPSKSYHGKVIGLQEKSGVMWSNSWSSTNAINMANGRANMKTIYGLSADFSGYPAFAWVHSLNDANENYSDADATGVWYLPAKDELSILYYAYSAYGESNFNTRLTAAGGTALVDNYYYWSSSELDPYNAWCIYFSDYGITYGVHKGDYNIFSTRCFLAF